MGRGAALKLLLDTHALLSALAEPHRLSSKAAGLVRDPANTVLVSAASAWEIATKHRIGKLPSVGPILAAYGAHLGTLRAEELPVTSAHALAAGAFAVGHRDPFDRMLAAQATLEGVGLLSDDPLLALFPGVQLVW